MSSLEFDSTVNAELYKNSGCNARRISYSESITNEIDYIGSTLLISQGKSWVESKEFKKFLSGGRDVDIHIRKNILDSIPCHMALLGYIQRHYFEASSHAIIPYDTNLFYFPSYLQQLEMESNGKSAKINGELVSKPCVPVIWGAVGTDAQHSFFQMLHQGVEKIPITFMAVL